MDILLYNLFLWQLMNVCLFLVYGTMSTSAVNMSHGAYMTHFCSHMPTSRRTQRMYVHLAFVNSSKTAVAYLPPTKSVWEFQLLHSFTDTWYYHLCVCLLNSSHSVEYALPSASDFNVYFLENNWHGRPVPCLSATWTFFFFFKSSFCQVLCPNNWVV